MKKIDVSEQGRSVERPYQNKNRLALTVKPGKTMYNVQVLWMKEIVYAFEVLCFVGCISFGDGVQ